MPSGARMAHSTLEKRVESLESELKKLRAELRAAKMQPSKDWRQTIGAFSDDGMQEILRGAMRLREADRKKSKAPKKSKRKPRP